MAPIKGPVKGVVVEMLALMQQPTIIQELLLHTLDLEGIELICRSTLGRATTRKILREHLLIRYFDDLQFNKEETPEGFYEVTEPTDPIFKMVANLAALYLHPSPLIPALSSIQTTQEQGDTNAR